MEQTTTVKMVEFGIMIMSAWSNINSTSESKSTDLSSQVFKFCNFLRSMSSSIVNSQHFKLCCSSSYLTFIHGVIVSVGGVGVGVDVDVDGYFIYTALIPYDRWHATQNDSIQFEGICPSSSKC